MNKAQEIDILRHAAQQLGPDSYCGVWLSEQIPTIAQEIGNDFPPTPSYAEAIAKARQIIEEAEREARAIVEHGKALATVERETAGRDIEARRDRLRETLRQQLKELDR